MTIAKLLENKSKLVNTTMLKSKLLNIIVLIKDNFNQNVINKKVI